MARIPEPVRLVHPKDSGRAHPVLAVWELTLKCDQPCQHCGSRAGAERVKELSTEECYRVVDSLARLACREVVVIGGEAYLRTDLHEIVAYIVTKGIRVTMQTGGRAFTAERARSLRKAGLDGLGASIRRPRLGPRSLARQPGQPRRRDGGLEERTGSGARALGQHTNQPPELGQARTVFA